MGAEVRHMARVLWRRKLRAGAKAAATGGQHEIRPSRHSGENGDSLAVRRPLIHHLPVCLASNVAAVSSSIEKIIMSSPLAAP